MSNSESICRKGEYRLSAKIECALAPQRLILTHQNARAKKQEMGGQMFRYAVFALISLAAGSAMAQQDAQTGAPPVATGALKAVVSMEEPLPGDHWTYEERDEIIGNITATRTAAVTEVTTTEISLRFKTVGSQDEVGLAIYDRSWNLIDGGRWRYSPNDGSGIQLPLTVGKSWVFQSSAVNSFTGSIWKRSGTSKVVSQQTVTTRAGTFETFEIETDLSGRDVDNPTARESEVSSQTWYAPAIDHWVRRTVTSHMGEHLRDKHTTELVDYGRRQ